MLAAENDVERIGAARLLYVPCIHAHFTFPKVQPLAQPILSTVSHGSGLPFSPTIRMRGMGP